MISVINSWNGTAHNIYKEGGTIIAGKTGTAQIRSLVDQELTVSEEYEGVRLNIKDRDHALFASYGPVPDPNLVVVVIVENGESGSAVAAPIAQKLIEEYQKIWTMSNRKPLDYSLNEPLYERLNPLQYIFKDIPLYVSLLAILIFGLMMLYSSSGQSFSMVARQSIYISGGLVLMTLISHLKPDSYKNILMHSYWLGLILLIYVLINPSSGYTTSRWIDFGFFQFQPSEVVRLLLPLSLAAYLCRKDQKD